MVSPRSSAIGRSRCDGFEDAVVAAALDEVAHLVARGARVGRRRLARLVLARQHPLGQRRPDDLGDAVARRRAGTPRPPAPARASSTAAGRRRTGRRRRVQAGLDLLGRPLAEADVAGLARVDDLGERLHRLLDRRLDVEAVALVEVDVVGLQALQRRVDLLVDLLGGQARGRLPTSGRRPWSPARTRRAGSPRGSRPRRLGGALAVGVGGVEEVDARRRRPPACRPRSGRARRRRSRSARSRGRSRSPRGRCAEPPSVHAGPLVGYGLPDAPTRSTMGYAP